MRFVAVQSSEARVLLPDLSTDSLMGQMHVIEEGQAYSGADGWHRMMKAGPLALAWLFWFTPKWVARPLYRWIALNRYRWFGKMGCENGVCAVHLTPRRTKDGDGKPASSTSGSPDPSGAAPPESQPPRQT